MPALPATITTDGSCYPNDGTGNGGWAAVLRVEGQEVRYLSGGVRRSEAAPVTNNTMEFTAVLEALKGLDPSVRLVTIRTDSQYVLKSLTLWYDGWVASGWVGSLGQPIKNRDLIETVRAEMDKRDRVDIVYVKGHNGDGDNEVCDRLAMAARQALNH